jgi:hypothetical protein
MNAARAGRPRLDPEREPERAKLTWIPGAGQVRALNVWAAQDNIDRTEARRRAIDEGIDIPLTSDEVEAARARMNSRVSPRPPYDKFRPGAGQVEALDRVAAAHDLSRNRVLELVIAHALQRREQSRSR